MTDQVRAAHILRSSEKHGKEGALEKIEEIKAEIDDGSDFPNSRLLIRIALLAHAAVILEPLAAALWYQHLKKLLFPLRSVKFPNRWRQNLVTT